MIFMSEAERRYYIKLRHYKRGTYGKTCYSSPLKFEAYAFARGYRSALNDLGVSELYVSVHDGKGRKLYEAEPSNG